MTEIMTLNDTELDAVCGGWTVNVGSYNTVTQRARQNMDVDLTATITGSSGNNTFNFAQGISQNAIFGSLVV
jgi:hypothetical protein